MGTTKAQAYSHFVSCRFKAIVCAIVRCLNFEIIEGWEIERKQGVVMRSLVKGQEQYGTQVSSSNTSHHA